MRKEKIKELRNGMEIGVKVLLTTHLKPQISKLIPQISKLKSQTSNLKSQPSALKPQISNLNKEGINSWI